MIFLKTIAYTKLAKFSLKKSYSHFHRLAMVTAQVSVSGEDATKNKASLYITDPQAFSTFAEKSLICNFFEGKSILITGGTGFIGSVLLQTVLEKIPGIGKIYCLSHSKEGQQHEKVKWVKGDIRQENFGLGNDIVKELQENVEIIFHLGAYTRWDLGLIDQVELNCDGALNTAKFAMNCKNIKHTVFSSSYWAVLNKKSTEKLGETVFQDYNGEAEYNTIKSNSGNARLDEWPNGYSYSKDLAERLLHQRFPELSLTIARVTSACASWNFPTPGYCRYTNALPALLRHVVIDGVDIFPEIMKTSVNDCIPVDIAVNMMLANVVENQSGGQSVIHLSSANRNIPSMAEMIELSAPIKYFATKEELALMLSDLDFEKATKTKLVLSVYETAIENKNIFLDYNVRRPLKWMTDEDTKLFPIDVDQVNWNVLVKNMVSNMKELLPEKRSKKMKKEVM